MERREFLKAAGVASAAGLTRKMKSAAGEGVVIVLDPSIAAVREPGTRWAADQLCRAITAKGLSSRVVDSEAGVQGCVFCVYLTPAAAMPPSARAGAEETAISPDGFRMVAARIGYVPAVQIVAGNARGFVYALLELTERVRYGRNPVMAMHLTETVNGITANEVRSVGRYFCSELEDKPWLYDKGFWPGYLDLLAASRFNRFCLAFGLEYDFPKGVTSDYLHFPYPYLLEVPGYDVRVMQLAGPDGKLLPSPVPLSAAERARNFEALQYIAAQTALRGLHFQLGIWTHAYQWTDSPDAYHRIEGLTPETHAAYCRDALAMILKQCPEIDGLTLRVHGESGIPEGSYSFWQTLFQAVAGCGRPVEIDMHAKGVDEKMIDIAVATGMPVKLGAKYSAEHQSLGYQQADIRALEIPTPGHEGDGPFSLSSGARSFTRYGYADFLRAGSRYKLIFRLWPGTQRHLLSADPETAAAYGRSAHFCGAVGLDLMEPLTFKGREGSGQPGGRCAYADDALNPDYDWQKFELYYRIWGQKLYNPDAGSDGWQRWLHTQFGAAADPVETSLSHAGRLLPLITSAHLPSASNHSYWPEMYTNMPIVIGSEPSPYSDTPKPKCFGTVSPLDPATFSTCDECAGNLLAEETNPRYSPIEVAQWLEDSASAAGDALDEARRSSPQRHSPAFRRMEADVLIQVGLGQFFAAKLRAGVLYALFQQSQERQAGMRALDQYRMAREAWASAARAASVYCGDITYGRTAMRRGHWSDRLAAIDRDIAALATQANNAPRSTEATPDARRAVLQATGRPALPEIVYSHTPPASFQPGSALPLMIAVPQETLTPFLAAVSLLYRHVNQAERWQRLEMQADGSVFSAAIPAAYTDSPFALQYRFELRATDGRAWLVQGFNADLSNQPYFTVMRAVLSAGRNRAVGDNGM